MQYSFKFTHLLKLILLTLFTSCSWLQSVPDLHVFFATNSANVGDTNVLRSIATSLQQQYDGKVITHEDLKDLPKISHGILLVADSSGARATWLKNLSIVAGLRRCYISHQLTPDIATLKGKVDLVVLPQHAATGDELEELTQSGINILTTVGMPHNTRTETLDVTTATAITPTNAADQVAHELLTLIGHK